LILGFWYLHCHIEYHNEIGIAMIFQEGNSSQMGAVPDSMLQCGDFDWSREEFLDAVHHPLPPGMVAS
jgi:hypothetical protein